MVRLILDDTRHSDAAPLPSLKEKLTFAKARIDRLECFRVENALRSSDEAFKTVFSLLPTLLHFNQPELIGYVENAPQGIYDFQLDSDRSQAVSAYLNPQFLACSDKYTFDGLYVMGSIGSITQTEYSDLDLWLCHRKTFSEVQQQALYDKLQLIKSWAKKLGVELNFFVMNPDAFKLKNYDSRVTEEHNGSAQHFFLLDEFYRSAIRLVGKRILWLHLDKGRRDYQAVIQQGVLQGELNLEEWIDFGDFTDLSIGEFFGASLWQLYKGIESPYKSAIKILLLESYAETYPKTDLISKKFKKLLLSNGEINHHFDPYLEMLEQVTTYLAHRKEFIRLDRLRCCFYIKASCGQRDSVKKQMLANLVHEWGWSERDIESLNAHQHWKIKQAMKYQQMIVDQLLQSYRNLIHFARKFSIDPNILPHDTDILMRSLYSAFEVVQGKIPLINENIAHNLAEDNVTFIEVGEGVATKQGWYLVNHAPRCPYDPNKRYIHYQKNAIKLVAWAYFNGLITAKTHIHLASRTLPLPKLRQFIQDLRLSFPVKAPTVQYQDLYHPNEIRNLIVAINLTQDPTANLTESVKKELQQIDIFNLGTSESGMIGSMSIIYRNMWNEILTQHFEGGESALKALKFISNKIYCSSAPPHSVNVFCYSETLTKPLQKLVKNLVHRCIAVQTGYIFPQTPQPKPASANWQTLFHKNMKEGKKAMTHCYSTSEKVQIPKAIANFASEGFLQFFFEDNADHSFNVYILDKHNKVEYYQHCYGSKESKIKKICRLYSVEIKAENEFGSFNFPQFYQLLTSETGISIVPFQSKQHREHSKP